MVSRVLSLAISACHTDVVVLLMKKIKKPPNNNDKKKLLKYKQTNLHCFSSLRLSGYSFYYRIRSSI